MSINTSPITPGPTVSLSVTSSTGNVALGAVGSTVMVTSTSGGNIAFIKFGTDSSVTAAVTDTPILPGAIYTFTVSPVDLYVAGIGSATTTLYFTTGYGS